MTEQHQFPSVADMMREHPSLAEAHLITPAWSPRSVLRGLNESRSRRRN